MLLLVDLENCFGNELAEAWSKNQRTLGVDNINHSRYDYGKGSRARRLVQAEEIRAVLPKTYRDTRDPDRRTYYEPGPGSADLIR